MFDIFLSLNCDVLFLHLRDFERPGMIPKKKSFTKALNSSSSKPFWWFLHPRNLTWNPKRSPQKRQFPLETIIFRFHVKFRGII